MTTMFPNWLLSILLMMNTVPGVPAAPTTGPSVNPPAREHRFTERMVIISIDGCRPDLLLRANTPNVHGLIARSTFTFWARTTPPSITLPSHTSMLTGVVPRKHKIEWNEDLKLVEPFYPKFPTLFEVAHRAGLTTAIVSGKAKFSVLNKPGTIDWAVVPQEELGDDDVVCAKAVEIIRAHQPQVMFVHLPGVDNAGHKYGWSSPEQMA